MTNFTTIKLVGQRMLVKGTDKFGTNGEAVLSTEQWDELTTNQQYNRASDAFEAAVERFFEPLTSAAEKLSVSLDKPSDPVSYVVLEEPTEGVEARSGHLVRLNEDSIVLRLIEDNDTDRLVWVDGDLEVLDSEPKPATLSETIAALTDAGVTDVADVLSEGQES